MVDSPKKAPDTITERFTALEAAIKKAKELETVSDKAIAEARIANEAHAAAVAVVQQMRDDVNNILGDMFGSAKVRQA